MVTVGVNVWAEAAFRKRPNNTGRCKMRAKANEPYDPYLLNARYYVSKRLTVGPQNEPDQRFHFVATRKAMFSNFTQTLTAYPLRPNRFYSTLGEIYCERSTLSNLLVFNRARHINCGIEQILVTLCLIDLDVNVSVPIKDQ